MKQICMALLLLGTIARAGAQEMVGTEDRSRFVEEPYKTAAPGMLAPSAYVAIAKNAIHEHKKKVVLSRYSQAIVTHRIYRDAPAADRDVVAVQYVYEGTLTGGGMVGRGIIYMREAPPIPVLQALIRKDGSKVYLNVIRYKAT